MMLFYKCSQQQNEQKHSRRFIHDPNWAETRVIPKSGGIWGAFKGNLQVLLVRGGNASFLAKGGFSKVAWLWQF